MARAVREVCLKIILLVLRLAGQRPVAGWQKSRRPTGTRGA